MRTISDFSSNAAAFAYVQQVLGDRVTLHALNPKTPYVPDVLDLIEQIKPLGYDEFSEDTPYKFISRLCGEEVASLTHQLLGYDL